MIIQMGDHMANIRYQLNGCIEQAERVNKLVEQLDLETIELNLRDLSAQMKVANAEMDDLAELIKQHLQVPDGCPTAD